MARSWVEEARREGPDKRERLPDGRHHVTLTRVKFGGKNGPFETRDGVPQIMAIFEDDAGREAVDMFTLSDAAMFRLAQLLSRCTPPADLERMDAKGVTPGHFAQQRFAEPNLVGRKLIIDVEHHEDGKFADITYVRPDDAPGEVFRDPAPEVDDDCSF